jgi:hypothetical protein
MQRRSKHASTTVVTVGNGVFYSVRAEELSWRQLGRPSQLRVSSVQVAVKKRISCNSELWIVEISDSAIVQLSVESWVLHRRLWSQNLRAQSWRISIIRSHCQGMADEDTAGWKRA